MSIHAVIVDYRSPTLAVLLDQLVAQDLVEAITVVDNASTESFSRQDPGGVVYKSYGKNLGYGAAINRALRHSQCDQLLILNPDISLGPDAITRLSETLHERENVALVGPRILTVQGDPYPSFRRFPSFGDAVGHAALGRILPMNQFTRRYRLLDESPNAPIPVDWISGACMLITREAFRAVAGFDASYHLYLEDVDLCWRLHRRGYDVVFDPDATVTHIGGGSTKTRSRRSVVAHHRSLLRYGMRSQKSTAAAVAVAVGVGGRMGVELARCEIDRRTSLSSPRW